MKTKTLKLSFCLVLFLFAVSNVSAVVLHDTATTFTAVSESYSFNNITTPATTYAIIDAYCVAGDNYATGRTMWIVGGTGLVLDASVTSYSDLQTTTRRVADVTLPYGNSTIIHIGNCSGTGNSTVNLTTTFTW